ncbi:CinA family protein [Boudabousia marimammalium]|uniref:CinA C-terminal domain-containing protein n=1 Tax=Boudabousia marimammalium TaxID=156892 RepID=A0A1Q5PNW3_9ACTO|nr:nicotinamide-nucleotide amidohydrolase family protein [Boudabousia marimammalium]OKL49264.1 hypothetical protein BM477_04560 [Boudabousia marimammalium]
MTEENELIALAKVYGLSIACAESLTGGLLCGRLVSVPGASTVVRGGIVTYQLDLKTSELGVDRDFLVQHGPYNAFTAAEMSEGIRQRLSADLGLSTTGVAGPGPDGRVPAGTFYVGVSLGTKTVTKKSVSDGSRQEVREDAVKAAISLALQQLRQFAEDLASSSEE